MDNSHLAFVVVFLAMLAEAVIFVETTFAHVDTLAVAINDFPGFGTIIFTFLAELATIVIAILTEKFRRNFVGARNAQAVSSDGKSLEIVEVILVDRNFRAEIRNFPILVAAEAVVRINVNVPLVADVVFGLPKVRNFLKLGNLTLDKVAIQDGVFLMPASAAVGFVETALEQKSVEGLVHEQLPCR